MTTKEKFDAYMEQAKYAASRHDARREIEWKVSLAFWATIVGAVGVLRETGSPDGIIDWWVALILVLGYAFFWLRGVHVANENDKSMADHFRSNAEQILLNPKYMYSKSPNKIAFKQCKWWVGFLGKWAMIFHLLTTIFLVYMAYKFTQ